MKVYIVDSNFFIQAHRASYPLDIALSFWKKVKQLANEGKIISIDKVKSEIYNKNDALEEWCKANLPIDFFKDSTQIMQTYSQVSAWAISKSRYFMPNAINEFLDADEADAFLIAYTLADPNNRTVVTHEISQPTRKNKIKIPDACIDLNVQYVNTIDVLRQLGESF
jgi:hypothetical protein